MIQKAKDKGHLNEKVNLVSTEPTVAADAAT